MIIIKKKVFLILIITIGFLFSFTLLIVNIVATSSSKQFVIYLDAGHGGFDGGCETKDKKILEKDITLNVSNILAEYLQAAGYKVYLTRYKDQALAHYKKDDMYKRVKLINESKACLYLSIHVNSFPSAVVKGAQVFYKSNCDESKKIASIMMKKLKQVNGNNKRSPLTINGKFLVDNVIIPGCLIELGFLTNNEDLKNLTNDAYLRDMCLMLFLGITEYLEYLK